MTVLSIRLLGPFQVRQRGKSLRKFRTNKVKALLGYLITEQAFSDWPMEQQRQELMALLWPDLPDRNAARNLRQVLYHLRCAIPWASAETDQEQVFLRVDRQTIGIHADAVYDVDLNEFLRLLANSESHQHGNISMCSSCLADLRTAVELYRGDFLRDFCLPDNNSFEEWVLLRREQLRQLVLKALCDETAAALQNGNYQMAQDMARRQLEIDNLRDKAYQQLMEAQVRAGNRSVAISTYQNYCSLLENELDAVPTMDMLAMAQAIQAGTI